MYGISIISSLDLGRRPAVESLLGQNLALSILASVSVTSPDTTPEAPEVVAPDVDCSRLIPGPNLGAGDCGFSTDEAFERELELELAKERSEEVVADSNDTAIGLWESELDLGDGTSSLFA